MSVDLVRTTLLDEANELIHGERAEAYGSALQNARDWAQMFSAATGLDVRPEHYPIAHICTKLVREKYKAKRDNWRDIAGYAGVKGKMEEEQAIEDKGIILPRNQGLAYPSGDTIPLVSEDALINHARAISREEADEIDRNVGFTDD